MKETTTRREKRDRHSQHHDSSSRLSARLGRLCLGSALAAPDIPDVLSNLIPAFDITANPINEGSSHIRPSRMRGMDSDKALMLVNGKRRHRSAVIFMAGWGGHGPDLNSIPSIALKSVEVLRDGASALYGSDAIVGVMNFNLKDSASDGAFQMMGSQFTGYQHEGNYQVAANKTPMVHGTSPTRRSPSSSTSAPSTRWT